MSPDYWRALRDCARTNVEKQFATGLLPWDKLNPNCIRLAERLKKRGWNIIEGVRHGQGKNGRQA